MIAPDLAGLASRLNLTKRPRSWAGTCPACDYPRAFNLRAGKGNRVRCYCGNGCSRETLNDALQRALGMEWRPSPPPNAETVEAARKGKQAAALRLFAGSAPIAGTVAAAYLARRGLAHLVGCSEFRFRGDCRHPEGGTYPALVARVLDAAGRTVACHRTFLTQDGGKAGVDPPRASLGPVWGGAVWLGPLAESMVVGEGIETSASAGLLIGLPAVAALSAGNLAAGLILPNEVCSVTIAADADGPGRRTAQDAATRWLAEGRQVRIATPDTPGQDFNDVLLARDNA